MNLKQYYSSSFPMEMVAELLNRRSSRSFSNREYALSWQRDGRPALQRFNSYQSAEQMRQDFVRRCPESLIVGAVYGTNPALRWAVGIDLLEPVERELVFDIDLKDYDDIRSCECKTRTAGLRVCYACWPLAVVSLLALRYLLANKFGFKDFLFTFSGSKGVHCWVLDESAATYRNEARVAIANYMWPFTSKEGTDGERHRLQPSSCELMDTLYTDVLVPFFERFVLGRILDLNTLSGQRVVLEVAKAHGLNDDVFIALPRSETSQLIWEGVKFVVQERAANAEEILRALVFRCTFPRIDYAVTTTMQHIIRCPFSVNYGSGYLCVPIDLDTALQFDLGTAPALGNFVEGLDSHKRIMQSVLQSL